MRWRRRKSRNGRIEGGVWIREVGAAQTGRPPVPPPPPPTVPPSSRGVALIAAERDRQQTAEGYSRAHDTLEHADGSIWRAAVAYATGNHWWWPWEPASYKPEAVREEDPTMADLVRAGALIAAELDRRLFAATIAAEARRDAR
jgi:hypothetical protein